MNEWRAFVEWACRVSRVSPRQTEAVVLIYAEGYTTGAAAAQMKLEPSKVEEYRKEAVSRLIVQEWDENELYTWERIVESMTSEESHVEHARALLDAVRNSQDPTPRPCTYDDNSRPVAKRDPLVSLDTAIWITRGTQTFPAKSKTHLTNLGIGVKCVRTPCLSAGVS